MQQIIKHYPITGRLMVTWGYKWAWYCIMIQK